MRKISHQSLDHNLTHNLLSAAFGVFLVLGVLGCRSTPDNAAHAKAEKQPTDCVLTVNTRPWDTFKSMATRMSQGEAVPQAELEAYSMLPAVADWRNSLTPSVPRPINLANWLREPWRAELGLPKDHKRSLDRITMARNFRYDFDRTAAIDSLLGLYQTGDQACALTTLLARWISPENIPTPLVLNCLPAMTEIRMAGGEIYLDTGVLVAGGAPQTTRAIATLLYRKLEAVPGTNPLEAIGEQAVAECLRVMANEGVAGWIERTTDVSFDSKHPTLCKVRIVPTDFYQKAQQTTDRFYEYLPEMLADPAVMAERGNGFARSMAGGNSFTQTGVAAAELIVGRLGEDRLQQVCRSVPDFWAAYQEAALLNDTPLPALGASGIPLHESLAPLPDSLYEPLIALLKRHFQPH